MRGNPRRAGAAAVAAITAAGLGYAVFALAQTLAFAPERVPDDVGQCGAPGSSPGITILKPLAGDDPGLADRLRSFCRQQYPDFEVIFGARDPGDPALETARRVASEFPGLARVARDDAAPRFANPKVDTLATMIGRATRPILAIVDDDMRVGPGYLRALAAPFADPAVGAATCPYRGAAGAGLASVFGAMGNHDHFAPAVLVARRLGPLRYCFGSTMAVRAEVLTAVGGLAALGSQLADDAVLGELVARAGRRVELVPYVVENVCTDDTFGELWRHELRWARTNRVLRPLKYAGLLVTFPSELALAWLALAPHRDRAAPALALAAAVALRFATTAAVRHAFGGERRVRWELVPLREALSFAVWACAYLGRDVAWDGEHFELEGTGEVGRPRGRRGCDRIATEGALAAPPVGVGRA